MKSLSKLTLFAVLFFGGANAVWADPVVVPTPVYFNDFSFATSGSDGIEIVGNGVFEDDADARFGRIFHNDPTLTKAIRTNYLRLPDNVLSHSTKTKEMTIGFWVNVKNAADFFWSPLFAAYGAAPTTENTWPMFVCETRGLIQLNNSGYCDFGINDATQGTTFNDGTPYMTSAWLDDAQWHYYTITLTETKAKVYVDGDLKNGWTVDGTSDGQIIAGLFTAGSALSYICLGGNQAWNWGDPDPAFGFDDFAVYDKALTKAQIDQIRANKLDRTVTGTAIGAVDNSTDYLGALSTKVTLKPGESYHYRFINYNKGENNWNNWILPVYDASDNCVITVRTDNWEDKHHVGETWGSNAGCTSNFVWDYFPGELNGATVDMTVTFTLDKVFNMTSTITTVGGSEWTYSYTNDYDESPISLTGNDYIKVAISVSRSWLDLLSEGYSAITKNITTAGWATLCSEYALDFTGSIANLEKAYAITGNSGTTLTLTEINQVVAAGDGILLKGSGNCNIPIKGSGTAVTGNLLKGVLTDTNKDANSIYVLMDGDKGVGFYKNNNAFTVGANTAYLNAADIVSAPSFLGFFDGEVTGVNDVRSKMADVRSDFFDLQGRRVAKPAKGLYIMNGKKVVIK